MLKLDQIDKKILIELESDARKSNRQIAKQLKLNPDLVRYRISKLEPAIWLLTFVNIAKIGYTDYGVFFTTNSKEVVDRIKKHQNVSYLAKLGGKYDYVMGILARDILEFQQIVGEFDVVKDISVRVQLFHFSKSYLLNRKKAIVKMPDFGGRITVTQIDDLDKKILQHLATNARMNVVELARIIKSPASTIMFHIKKLRKNQIIVGFNGYIRCQSYGYQNHLITLSASRINEKKLFSFCQQHQYITYLIKTIGKWDYEISIEVPDQKKLQEILSEIRENFPEANLNSVILFEELKYNLFPFE